MADQNAPHAASAAGIPPGSRPNIVLIVLDDLGYGDLSAYRAPEQGAIPTPRMDSIGNQGMLFRQAYAGAAVCTPSRAALLTGRYAQRVGLPEVIQADGPCGLPEFEYTVAEALRGANYRTGIFGKWHLGDPRRGANPKPDQLRYLPRRHGFDRYLGIPYSNDMGWPHPSPNPDTEPPKLPLYEDDVVDIENVNTPLEQGKLHGRYTDAAIAFIREGAERGQPFFAYIPHNAPHEPFHVPEGMGRDRNYHDVVREADRQVGRVLDELRDRGLEESTLVIVTSDNGPWHVGSTGHLRGRKTDPYEGGIRVPFMARWPGRIPVGESREPISFVDVLPTLIELAGADEPPADGRTIDGISIRSALAGGSLPPDRMLYFYGDFQEGAGGSKRTAWMWHVDAVRWQNWKLLWPESVWPTPNMHEKLFNLVDDPNETTNVVGDPDNRETLERLRASAQRFDAEIQRNKAAAIERACPGRQEAE